MLIVVERYEGALTSILFQADSGEHRQLDFTSRAQQGNGLEWLIFCLALGFIIRQGVVERPLRASPTNLSCVTDTTNTPNIGYVRIPYHRCLERHTALHGHDPIYVPVNTCSSSIRETPKE